MKLERVEQCGSSFFAFSHRVAPRRSGSRARAYARQTVAKKAELVPGKATVA